MKKKLLILIFGLLVNFSFSQEIKYLYQFKKEQKKKMFTYFELDSLVLYKNGSFYRKAFFSYHEINYSELKGNWKIEKGILHLEITKKNENNSEKKWKAFNGNYRYLVKYKKLIPINDSFEIYATRKLKLFE